MKLLILFITCFSLVSLYAAPQIAYIHSTDLYVMDADGSNPTQLTNSADFGDATPKWSPDGSLIAYASGSKETPFQIYTIKPDGTDPQNLSNNADAETGPDWSPDGKKIVFAAPAGLYTMDANGGNRALLLAATSGTVSSPSWSADGAKIVYSLADADKNSEIWVVNADGSDAQKVVDGTTNYRPCWSPDGNKIAYLQGTGKENFVYVMNADGSSPVQLTSDGSLYPGKPTWLPDGSKIAFTVMDESGKTTDIYTVDPDGSNLAAHLTTASINEGDPDWLKGPTAINSNLNNLSTQQGLTAFNTPNPFISSTLIKYSLPREDFVTITVFDNKGKTLRTLEQRKQNAGMHNVVWDGKDNTGKQMVSGQYYYQIKTGNSVGEKCKMMLVK